MMTCLKSHQHSEKSTWMRFECTDIAKGLGVPVIHANADDPEAVVHACRVAAQWRSSFGKDVVIDICGYRRFVA
jgi:2-oxoglutarate dehydrogenase complex dehydrogenase (E1) component-like enzyme